jgi:Caspase recruitment domain
LTTVTDSVEARLLVLRHLADQLQHIVEPDYGLLDQLLLLRVLTLDEVEEIRHHIGATRKSRMLLDRIIDKSDEKIVDNFVEALIHTDQQHVVNVINHSGGER